VLEDTLITVLENFATLDNIKKHKPAAILYYYLVNGASTSSSFKAKLLSNTNLEILRFNPHFSAVYPLNIVENDALVDCVV